MQDLRQIQVIKKALDKQRERYLFELARVNQIIEKKILLVKKMLTYLNEYNAEKKYTLSKSIPVLHQNLNSFTQQIEDVIAQTESETENLIRNRDLILKRIEKADQKISVMQLFEDRVIQANNVKAEKIEQSAIDDMSSTKHLRGLHE